MSSEQIAIESTAASTLPGPFPVGDYAAALRRKLRSLAHVQVVGEMVNLRVARARVYFELHDAAGALPCSAWRNDWEAITARCGIPLVDGMEVVVGGGCDYYPGTATASPSFSFAVTDLRVAGVGDLLARIERLRRTFADEGLLERQKLLDRPTLPRTIGVVCSERGKVRDDIVAGLRRRRWGGRVVWAFAPVQDRRAAVAIATALRDLAATTVIDVAIVARGGGSLLDLMAFCDETLCRSVALLPMPVIASVGHHADRTLLDDVAALSCSTPTHAAEAAVPLHCGEARAALARDARRLHGQAGRAVVQRARLLARQARAPGEHVERERARMRQWLRELRASSRRQADTERRRFATQAAGLNHARTDALRGGEWERGRLIEAARTLGDDAPVAGRRRELEHLGLTLHAHDPARTLARGYALVYDRADEPLTSAAAAREAQDLKIAFSDAAIDATIRR